MTDASASVCLILATALLPKANIGRYLLSVLLSEANIFRYLLAANMSNIFKDICLLHEVSSKTRFMGIDEVAPGFLQNAEYPKDILSGIS